MQILLLLLTSVIADVNVKLNSHWKPSSLLLQVVEFVAEDDSKYEFIEELISSSYLDSSLTDLNIYEKIVESDLVSAYLPGAGHLTILKAYLATCANCPKIQAFYHYYAETILLDKKDCEIWFAFNGVQHCSLEKFENAVNNFASNAAQLVRYVLDNCSPDILESDQVYEVQSPVHLPTAILYADLLNSQFVSYFQKAMEFAREARLKFVLRYKPSALVSTRNQTIVGYGVELAVKNTEYKVSDDRDINSGSVATDEDANDSEQALFGESVPVIKPISKEDIQSIFLLTQKSQSGQSVTL
jgi:UDP-glucose:glycoprotein glucosyltransferase